MKKGFTLIELLAVIVVVGLLATIASYSVTNSIKNSREKSLESTISNIIDSTKNYVLENDTSYSESWKLASIDTLKAKGYLPNTQFTNPVTGEELSGCVKYRWNNVNNQYEFEWIDSCQSNYICKRATTLHTETCSQTDSTYYCSGAGYTASGSKGTATITYGNKTVTTGILTSGDAFDCDVNGDGDYDPDIERFYYVSGIDGNEDSEYAVLIYYNNTLNGQPNNTSSSLIAYDTSAKNYNGPRTAIANLPTIQEWSNVSLSSTTRAITTQTGTTSTTGGTLPTAFSYINSEGVAYAARLLTTQEVESACNITVGSYITGDITGELDNCNYLMENTKYSNGTMGTFGPWLETPYAPYSDSACYVNGYRRHVNYNTASLTASSGVRPVIEVLKSDILY